MRKKFLIQNIIVPVMIIIAGCFLFYNMDMPEGSMTREEISSAIQRLTQITDSNDTEPERISKLEELAKQVGAGTVHTKIAGFTTTKVGNGKAIRTHQDPISEAELIQNINQALQTHMFFDSCKTANKQYKIAVCAALIAVFSIFITWNISKKKVQS